MHWPGRLLDPTLPGRTLAWRSLLLALLLAACALRVGIVWLDNPMDHLWSDPHRHWLNGTRPLSTAAMAAVDPVGYQLYLGLLAKLTVHSPALVAYWTSLLSLLGPWLWYRFLRELKLDRSWALAGWVVLAALPSWLTIYSYFMQETLMLPLLGAALWATWRCRRKHTTASFVVAVALWLAAGLTRGICLPLGAVAMAWCWIEQDRKLAKATAALALVVLVLAPLAGRSWSLLRMISPHGVGQMVQLYLRSGAAAITIEFKRKQASERVEFLSPAVTLAPLMPLSDWRSQRAGVASFVIDLEAGRRDWDAALAGLPPFSGERAARLTAENVVQLMFAPSWPEVDPDRPQVGTIDRIGLWLRWLWAPLALVCAAGLLAAGRHTREQLLPALLVTWFIVQGLLPLAVNEGRYRKPFEGLLVAQCLVLGAVLRRRHRAFAP